MKPNIANILENEKGKRLFSESYNFFFDKRSGFFARWGKTHEEDPLFSPFGPEICDMEISTVCSGVEGIGPCKFCYKSNTKVGENMSFETFKKVFHKLPSIITQIAFGIGNISAHPDLWNIFQYCREHGVIPNVTVNGEGITDEIADKLVGVVGACAVSIYDKEKSYDAVKKLTDRGLKQVNIHQIVHSSNFEFVKSVINDIKTDARLEKLNAIVFLSLKPKGRGKNECFKPLSQEKFNELIKLAETSGINYGLDSCAANKFIKSIENHLNKEKIMQMIEPCESLRMSLYVNVQGHMYPCSFMEGEVTKNAGDWITGLDVANCNDFMKDIWMNEKSILFRNACIDCINSNEGCLHYKI